MVDETLEHGLEVLLEGRAGDVGVGQGEAGVVRFQRVAEADAGGGQGAE